MPPDVVLSRPRSIRTFLLKSMEVQLEEEAQQAAAARERQKALMAQRASRKR